MQQDLEVDRVTKRYGAQTAVDALSLAVAHGSFFSILGPSGCGKTTLLRMSPGFLAPDDGDVRIGGAVDARRRAEPASGQHGVPASRAVPDDDGRRERRLRPRTPRASRAPRSRGRVDAMLKRVGLPGAQDKRVDQLSGGQKQRVAIARSLVLEPTLLLLDEPLGALDLKLREHMKIELKQLQADFGTTFVYITHDQSEALVLSDRVAVMNAGRFEQVGTPQELYYQPRTPFVAGFVGANNRVAGRAVRVDGEGVELATADGLAVRARMSGAVCRGRRCRGVRAARGRRSGARRGGIAARRATIFRSGRKPAVRRRQLGRAGPRGRERAPRSGSRCRRRDASPICVVGEPVAFGFDAAACRLLSCRRQWRVSPLSAWPRRARAWRCCCCSRRRWCGSSASSCCRTSNLRVLSLRARVAPRVYEFSLAQYRTFVDEPLYWHTFVRTAAMSILATGCTLLIAFPAAWYIAKIARGRAKSVLFVLCLIPFWVSETVRTLGWMILLRESGRAAAPARRSRHHGGAGRDALPRRDDPGRPRLHVDAVHGRAAGRVRSRTSTIR